MSSVKVFYGSTTGATEAAAEAIAAAFGVSAVNISSASAADLDADLLILGSSTWGMGELQDDWYSGLEVVGSADLTGKKVAVFGCGDQNGFSDTYCDALGLIAAKAIERGATIVGETSTEGYQHSGSAAEADGKFCGLALDNDNESEKTDERIAAWVEVLKQA